jgi:hypothetical protein
LPVENLFERLQYEKIYDDGERKEYRLVLDNKPIRNKFGKIIKK